MRRYVKRGVLGLIVLAVVVYLASWLVQGNDAQSVQYRTAPLKRDDLVATISATGTVEPEEVVNVGAQVAGRILEFGQDGSGKTIDYGSIVEEGMVLARIDSSLYAADVATTKAQVEQSKAAVIRAEADLVQMQAKLFQAERDWNRAKKLGPSEALSQSDFDAAQSAHEVAKANVGVAKASILQAQNAVSQAQAVMTKARQNLDYCTIRSPVRGVIIDRRVNIGQTVVSSLNAPSLFLIAKDLKRLQVWVAVNEADIGNIVPGQAVVFTVDAYPGQVFQGEVGKVRLNAAMTQNVVTFTVEVLTDNSDGRLLPYLTANVKFMLSRRDNVLMVPNAALRWSKEPDQAAQADRPGRQGQGRQGSGAGGAAAQTEKDREEERPGTIWVLANGSVKPIPVRVGVTDGTSTEVEGDGLKEGMQVVTGEQPRETPGGSTPASPFTPKLFRR